MQKVNNLTRAFCASASLVVSIGVVANGSRVHAIGFSFFLVATLSPTALFLPATNFEHFLVKMFQVSHGTGGQASETHSSDNE
jgi:hypothetical protein